LPGGLISGATNLTVDVAFHTTAGGVILGYQNRPLGVTPDQYMPALYVGTDGRVYAQIFDGSFRTLVSSGLVNDGHAHHAVLVETGSAQSLYVDGDLVGTLHGTPVPLNMTFDQLGTGYTLGHPGTPYGFIPFVGTLDNVLITTGTTLTGSVAFPGAGNNQITFTPANAGTYTISLEAIQPDGGTPVARATLAVVAAAPAGVDIHGQPSNVVAGQPIEPAVTVAVVDAYGNTVTDSNALVTLAIASGPTGARLEGHSTVRAVHGVATFGDLKLNVAGSYTLTATGGKLTADFSNRFTVAPANVSRDVEVHSGRLHHDGLDAFEQTVTLTNTSNHTLHGPLALVLTGLPSDVRLIDARGSYQGNPYVEIVVPDGIVAPGQDVTVRLDFCLVGHHDRDRDDLTYSIDVLEGI
jgi:hypothetical protein